jgi:mRNA-degrading endonuclease RelE of RelBE toxin-antitoxin system
VINYQAIYEDLFIKNLKRYSSFRQAIKKKVEKILINPYHNNELLGDVSGRLNLKGCRSVRINKNFRMIFVICEECRKIDECGFCFCENFTDKTVVFLTVGPHDKAYQVK